MVYIYIFVFSALTVFGQQKIDVYILEPNLDKATLEVRLITQMCKLYNKKNKNDQIKLNYIVKEKFQHLFDEMLKDDSKHTKLALMGITVTEERKKLYDFSDIYLPVKYNLVTLPESKVTPQNWSSNNFSIVSSQVVPLNEFRKRYKKSKAMFTYERAFLLKDQLQFLSEKKYDVLLVEGIGLNTDGYRIVKEFYEDDNGYGIMYPKGSKLRDKLNLVLKYLVSSNIYYKILRDVFGAEESRKLFNYNKNKIFR